MDGYIFRVSFNQRPLKEDDLMAATTAQGMDPAVVDDIIRRLTEDIKMTNRKAPQHILSIVFGFSSSK
ncbi:hypothetical protein ES288_D01G144800v1 [Gossypium darwinii]|uniref:Uncharacterized protein n=1 Tax=Gossypium darwinii TaxID=34276 RepID=A0A5D2DPW6_GOSDA|nr:hypothetical protein ES288_D01G144700v1 [Gossypium darwinii]TYG83134.1 hypothetical protein ES288_D01G144800v1 [Gossypium darwinii]